MALDLGFGNIFPDSFWINNNMDMPSYEHDRRIHFRREFELDSVPAAVPVNVTADARYTLYVNGKWVGHGPARGIQAQWPYDEIDIAPYLVPGKNVIAALLYHYGSSNYTYIYEGIHGFLLAGSAGNVNLGTNEQWLMREAPGYIRDVGRCASQYAYFEYFDCRQGEDNWMMPDYQCGSDWHYPREDSLRLPGCAPWTDFIKRYFPMPGMEMLYPELRLQGKLISGGNWQNVLPLREYYKADKIEWDGSCGGVSVYDFGGEVVGHLCFEIDSPADDTVLDFFCFEAFDAEGHPWIGTGTTYGGRLYLKKGINRHELTMPWGLRAIMFFDRTGGSLKISPAIRETVYPMDIQGKFKVDDERLSGIWKICLETQRHCMYDAYMDGPWREFAQWWGDALVQAVNTFALSTDDRLLVRGHEIVAARTLPNGLTYGVAPAVSPSAVLPDYSAIFLISLYSHYYQTGSTELYTKHRETAYNIIKFFVRESAEGLMPVDKRYWYFVDWCRDLDKEETYNLLAVYGMDKIAELAMLTGDEEVAAVCRECAERICAALKLDDPAPHAVALAVMSGRFTEYHEKWKNEIVLPFLASDHRVPRRPTCYFVYYFFEAAKILGCDAEIIDAITRWWGEMLDLGLTNTPEHWPENFTAGNSRCHAWSAHPMVFFRDIICGVRQNAVNWKEIIFKPLGVPGKVVEGTFPTPHGNIEVVIDRREGSCSDRITLPEGITQA